jgi:hypothetical protein
MAYLSVVVPNQLNNGTSLPTVTVLAQGLQVPIYATDGTYISTQFSSNPAWILLDVLRRSGWTAAEIDITSFAAAAAYCDELINSTDLNGNPITLARFGCNLVLKDRRSAGDVVRGVRNAARLYLTYGPGGVLQLQVENTIALQQPAQPAWSNSTQPLDGGWPSYEFGDGSTGFSGILRLPNGEPSVTLTSRSIADTPNRISVEFQDALNGYQQDSYEVVDPDDVALAGQEVSTTLAALGIPNYDQAGRIVQFNLDKSVHGNTYIAFETSIKAFGIRPGDLITLTYLKEGLTRQPLRVLKISPATNYRTSTITAQFHDDAWYSDTNGQVTSPIGTVTQGNASVGVPRPLIGTVLDENGDVQFGVVESTATSSDGTVEELVSVSFVPPAGAGVSSTAGPGVPLLSLVPTIGTGGTLAGGQNLYYAVSGEDSTGDESGLSFIVMAPIASAGSSVTLSGLSFAPGTSVFDVYRGSTPAELFRIASEQALAAQFTDTGFANQLIAPPDSNFDHANFYWRMELQPESGVTLQSATTVGNASLQMTANCYRNMIVRITRGTGAGQERAVAANDTTSLTIAPAWSVAPDATSFFVVAETGWQFGALTTSSPVQFEVSNRSGEVVQLTGRAANVNNVECAPEISTVTRWQIGGGGTSDSDVPPMPFFGLGPGQGGGTVNLSGVSFTDLTNTRTISAATLTMYYWDELQGTPTITLASAVGTGDTVLTLSSAGPALAGSYIQIDLEVICVTAVENNGTQYTVTRAMDNSLAAAHAAQAPVYQLVSTTVIAPFPPEFFGSPYSGSWSYPIALPDVRVASAELFVTNQKGNSPTQDIFLTHTTDSGLRTLASGQYSIQVDGYLAVDQSAAPALVMEASHSVRDVYAVLGTAADAAVGIQLNLNGASYCQLTFAPGATLSNTVDGNTLAPLPSGAQVTLSVLSVGQTNPGCGLTVIIRL